MRTRILLRLVLVVITTVGLMLIWLAFLPRLGQASSSAAVLSPAGEPSAAQSPTPAATPDPRWVEIVRRSGSSKGAAPAADAPAASQPTINLNLTDQYAAGRVPSPATVKLAILDQGQEIYAVYVDPLPDGGGFFYLAGLSWDTDLLQPGYALWLTQGATVISMTIPTLTSLAYPQTDILSGTAPASADLLAYLFPYAAPGDVYTATTTAGSDGVYQLAWAPLVDLRPRDDGYLLYTQDAFRMVYRRFVAPFLHLHLGGPDLFGAAAPGSLVEIFVEDAAGADLGYFTAYSWNDGFFSFADCTDYGKSGGFAFSPSDRVIVVAGGQTFSMTVSSVTAHVDPQAGQVWGQASPNQPVEVVRFGGLLAEWEGCIWQEQPLSRETVTATAGGGYTATLPLQVGNYGAALATTPEGNQVYTRFAVPYLHVALGKPPDYYPWAYIWGQVAEPSVPITVEIQGPSGYLKDWYTMRSWRSGYFSDIKYSNIKYSNLELSLEGGDLLTLTTPHAPPVSLLLPGLTASADSLTEIVSGQAPPFSQLFVIVYENSVQLTVTADAEGQYSADFGAMGGFLSYARGEVVWTSPQGYHVVRNFQAPPIDEHICPPRFYSAQIGGNELNLEGSYGCGIYTLRLRGADGLVKLESVISGYQLYFQLYDVNQRPVLILPGDQLEIASGGDVEISVIPTLTVNLDPQAEQVYGQAPPGAEINLYFGYDGPYWTGTVSAQGTYTADLAGIIDLDAGSWVMASLQGRPNFYRYGVIPVLETWLYHPQVAGRLDPLTPYTLTLSTPITSTAPITGYADADGDYPPNAYPVPEDALELEDIFHGLPGDSVQVETPTRLWQMVLPMLTARVDATAGIVSGQAPPASRLGIRLFNYDGLDFNTVITATASGTYSTTFPVHAGSQFIIGRLIHFTTYDILTYLQFYTPSWHVTLGTGLVNGYIPIPGAPITVTLQSGDGAFSQVITETSYNISFFFEFDRLIQPGDHLWLYTVDGLASEYTVPVLTAAHDFARRVLEGQSPTDGDLVAYLPTALYATRHVRIAPDGRYGVDTSDLDMFVGGRGSVFFTDRHGNTVSCSFTIRGYLDYLPVIWLLGSFP